MDYSVVVNAMFWNRYKNGETMSLFDPAEVPDLYEAYYRDSKEFEMLLFKSSKKPIAETELLSPAYLLIEHI